MQPRRRVFQGTSGIWHGFVPLMRGRGPGAGAEKECRVLRRGNSGEWFSLMDAAGVGLKGSRKNMAREEREQGGFGQARCADWFRSCRACIGHRAKSLYVYNAYGTNVTYACQVISMRATLPACRRPQVAGNSITLSAFAFLSRRSKRSTERLSASAGSAAVICLRQSGRSLGQTTSAVARFRHTRKPAVPRSERGEFRKNCRTSFIPHSKPSLSAHPPQ